jgi:hypothetical protein
MYQPTINDRVQWKDKEGWVYFICSDYFTLELSVKPKNDNQGSPHKKIHLLLVVYNTFYNEVQYLGKRATKYDDSIDPTL